MIKLPKEVAKIVGALEAKGYETYCTGDCVRLSLAGEQPVDWDIVVKTDFENIRGMFEDAKVFDEAGHVLRFDYVERALAETDEDGTAVATEEEVAQELIIDVRTVESVEDYLSLADFTVNAIADSTTHGMIDPHGGKNDISKKLIKTVGEADAVFKAKPYLMLHAIALVAEMDFDLAKSTADAIMANVDLLGQTSVGRIREEFINMMAGPAAGKAMKMMAAFNMMQYIYGPNVGRLTHREISDIEIFSENIGKTFNVPERRIALLYSLISKKKAHKAIEYMNYEDEMKMHLVDTVDHIVDIYFLTDGLKYKAFLAKMGMDRYQFIHNVAKAQLIVFGGPTLRVEGRNYILKEIQSKNEPIFIEDLKITAEELIEAGVCEDDEKARTMLLMLCDAVHREPKENTNKKLMDRAKDYKKHPLKAAFRNVNWG